MPELRNLKNKKIKGVLLLTAVDVGTGPDNFVDISVVGVDAAGASGGAPQGVILRYSRAAPLYRRIQLRSSVLVLAND